MASFASFCFCAGVYFAVCFLGRRKYSKELKESKSRLEKLKKYLEENHEI